MGAPRGGTEIEEERKQCGPAASPGSARTQAKRTTERTHRRGQPAHVAGIEATRAGSKIAKPVAKGNRRDRGEKRREVQARCQPRSTSQAMSGQRSIPFAHDITGTGGRGSTRATAGRTTNNNPPRDRQTPFIASKKRPGPRRRTTWCGTHQVADATAHAFFHECQALCRMARDGMSPHIRSMALPSVGLGRIPSTAFGNS
jgi:hypothetical protein